MNALVVLSSLEAVLIWVRSLWFLLAFKATGPLVRMVMQIAADMR